MNLKLHIIVSVIFLLLIFGALSYFSASNQPAATPPSITSDRFIQVSRATWGENCNPYIESARQQVRMGKAQGPAPEMVRRDNALRAVSTLCNNLEQCQFSLSLEGLGFDPVAECNKEFSMEYRCFLSDRNHKIVGEDGDTVLVDCTSTED